MKRLIIGCLSVLWAGAVAGQILECVDAKGKKEYAQVCPSGTVRETKLMNSGAGGSGAGTAPAATKSIAEQEADFRKRNLARPESEAKAEKDKAEAKDAERNCFESRAQVKQLQSGGRIAKTDPNTGERSFLQDKDRAAEIANAQKAADSWCNKK
jgi:hypothetical protein